MHGGESLMDALVVLYCSQTTHIVFTMILKPRRTAAVSMLDKMRLCTKASELSNLVHFADNSLQLDIIYLND